MAGFVVLGQELSDSIEGTELARDATEGVGEAIYEVVLAQLTTANQMLESSHRLARRLLESRRSSKRGAGRKVIFREAVAGSSSSFRIRVVNPTASSARLGVRPVLRREGRTVEGASIRHESGCTELASGDETLLRITLATANLEKGAYRLTVTVTLTATDGRAVSFDQVAEIHVVDEATDED